MKLDFLALLALPLAVSATALPCKRADGTLDPRCGLLTPVLTGCFCKMNVPGQNLVGSYGLGQGIVEGQMQVNGGEAYGAMCWVTWDRGTGGACDGWTQVAGPTGSGCNQLRNTWSECTGIFTYE